MKKNIAETVRELVEKPLAEAGFSIWDISFEKEGRDYLLLVEIDKPDGISLDECTVANDIINELVDNADPIEGAYCLEVASAGLTRNLKTPFHFEYAINHKAQVDIKTFTPVNGIKEFNGCISEIKDNIIIINDVAVERKNIAKAAAMFE